MLTPASVAAVPNPDALVARLIDRITPEAVEVIDRAYELRFVGEDRRWWLDLRADAPTLAPSARPSGAVCGIGLPAEDLEQLLDGQASLGLLFHTGRLRVFDDIGDAMRLERVFAKAEPAP